ncbi:MAG: alkaline shock response membrane anchor protein AmaP [Limnochordaceae bacterium]|nr:alkaline shock response membrane anchor protein AmaP [Limnochordaceae bacterium]
MYPLSGSTSASSAAQGEGEPPGRLPVIDRALVLVAGLVVVAVGFVGMTVGLFGWDAGSTLSWWVAQDPNRGRVLVSAVGAALAIIGAAALRPAVRSAGRDRTIVRSTSLGEVHISVRAIQTLARRAASQVQGIREAEVQVTPSSVGDVNVRVILTVAPDEPIPELCDQVQSRIDQYLRQTAGVSCGQIRLVVRGISRDGHRSRSE